MLDSGHVGESGECCTSCGQTVCERSVYYFGRVRVCETCFKDLNAGTERLAAHASGDIWNAMFGAACLMLGMVWGLFLAGCL